MKNLEILTADNRIVIQIDTGDGKVVQTVICQHEAHNMGSALCAAAFNVALHYDANDCAESGISIVNAEDKLDENTPIDQPSPAKH